MAKGDDLFGPGRSRVFSPYLADGDTAKLREAMGTADAAMPTFVEEMRSLARRYIDDGDSLKLRAVCLLVADLFEQGWRFAFGSQGIVFQPPGLGRDNAESVDEVKERVRQTLQAARLRQLQEPSVRSFIERTERNRCRVGSPKASIVDLIDSGAELKKQLEEINTLPDDRRDKALAGLVDPVLEVCEAGKRCPDTGIPLNDIWRYFRHTWAHEYRSVPGRQMLILIRNAARPKRPVMGIAMLASPVMRLATRDNWIGWLRQPAQEKIESGEWDSSDFANSLMSRIDDSIQAIRWDDLASKREINDPTEEVAMRLDQRATGAAFARDAELRAHYGDQRASDGSIRPHKGAIKSLVADENWLAASDDLLFIRKRADGLAKLLFAKQLFKNVGLRKFPERALKTLFETRDGQRALDIALAELRKAGLSSQVADVSICGAVHPYNELLGGKLVAMMLASQELRDAYSRRYGGKVSVIASQMAGRAISKPADLRLITTTSLYGLGSSQYNRLVLRAADHDGLPFDLRWGAIGKSLTGGFGTFHLGNDTAHALRQVAISRHDARRVNNRFGEGTSPRLRQIREGLDALGIKSDDILHHATPRIFYGCELFPSARYSLCGLKHSSAKSPASKDIAEAWRQRWLSARVRRRESLDALQSLGPMSVRASLHADSEGQFFLPIPC